MLAVAVAYEQGKKQYHQHRSALQILSAITWSTFRIQ